MSADRGDRLSLPITTLKILACSVSGMFDEIMEKFEDSPSQQRVIRLLLERGFSVNDEGRVVSGGIEIPNTGIAREIDVDRRVVDATTTAILEDEQLRRIFQNISAIPSLMDLAPVLDLSVLTVTVSDAEATGLVAAVTGAIAEHDIAIRQVISDDPEFSDEPKLYVITGQHLPGELINEIRELSFVRKIELQ
ncbi:putative regulator of amino acid metabolism, contains ACT domain [Halapricum desulfuricans]|uniref:Putative regulator of amino acid metabolism, contains ACT domain n=2 Tax=Halapricum desulfuricans TaxID=2841257 RepID=A0A897MZT9_9EURY|nr:putative regulator of amino acid metabolism, contains ACT domain [Halapricum desulfuricans]